MKRYFERRWSSLDAIFTFVDEFMAAHHIAMVLKPTLWLVIEELFTNMVKYNPDGPQTVAIALSRGKNFIQIELVDRSDTPFDVSKAGEVDTTLPLEKRRPGGVGLHLVKNLVDNVEYSYHDGINRITVTKFLEQQHAESGF